ncbi:hypothetical protein GCM10011346_05870 [Oceanobacillus neutriphilus]|uniref:Uncharacterized protein n=1 Tax=Oceanobacillus neutriphilus TaxID=531815 RepID=A0ABQ2NRD5_9BACI|nr:hypothetical protein GCM10011346_05870 [Oceanobacillus neutriphilus]
MLDYIFIAIIIILVAWIAFGYAILRGTKRILKQRKNRIDIFTLKLSEDELIKNLHI